MPRPSASLRNLLGATRRQLLFALNVYVLIYALHCLAPIILESKVVLPVLPRMDYDAARHLMYAANLLIWLGSWFLASVLAARVLPRGRPGSATLLAVFTAGALGTLGALREFVCHMKEWNYVPHLLLVQMRTSERIYELAVSQASGATFKTWMVLFGGFLPLLALIVLAVVIIGATRAATYFVSDDEIDPSRLSGRNTR